MEDYLQNMKNLRSQMNDFEDQASNVSVEEQKQKTAIQTTERDLQLVKSETERLQAEIEQMSRENGKVSCQILEKKKMITKLEAESLSLSQTLELVLQERDSAFLKLEEKRAYYSKVIEDMGTKFHGWQEWYDSRNLKKELGLVQGRIDGPNMEIEGTIENISDEMHSSNGSFEVLEAEANKKYKELVTELDAAKGKLQELTEKNSTIVSENCKAKQTVEQLQHKVDDFPLELKGMEVMALEEEHKALLSDKAQEMEYLQSLRDRISQLKGISHVVKCDCGEEYKVELTV